MKKGIIAIIAFASLLLWIQPAFANQGPFEYVSPRPEAELVSAGTSIAVRHGDPIDESSVNDGLFTVNGADSGMHEGVTLLADDDLTIIFKPDAPFTPAEVVTMTLAAGLKTESGDVLEGLTYTFTVSPRSPEPGTVFGIEDEWPDEEMDMAETLAAPLAISSPKQIYHTLPDTFPGITITVPATDTGEGYLFLSNYRFRSAIHPYLLILDNEGEPVFYREMPPAPNYVDFKKQRNGLLTYFDTPAGVYQALDDTYRFADSYQAGNGYKVDAHGIQVREDGHILLQIYDDQPVDMSEIVAGGMPTATVTGAIVQELDPSRNVIFEWRSWDHIPITDASDRIDLTSADPDVTHINSVDWDSDGNILISLRHLDEITKIDRSSADVIWRMGGKGNQFTFVDEDRPFSHQHDARRLANGHITLYDNGNTSDPRYSRAVEYKLNETIKMATKVWEYRNQPQDVYGRATGSAQRLANGNTVIAWGGLGVGPVRPVVTEVKSNGVKAFEMFLEANQTSYRVLRQTWAGQPFEPPKLVASAIEPETRLHFSWNGAADVASYQIYGGLTSAPDDLMTVQEKTGFETASIIGEGLTHGCSFYRVMPLNAAGDPSSYSNLVFAGDASCDLVGTLTPAAALNKAFSGSDPAPTFAAAVAAPAATVSETVTLVYSDDRPLIQPPPEGWRATGMHFILNAHIRGNPQPDFALNRPVTLTLDYSAAAADGLDKNTFELRRWDGKTQTWSDQGITLLGHHLVSNRLTVSTTMLGEFAVFGRLKQTQIVQDGGFELGADNPHWDQESNNVPFVICDRHCTYDNIPQSYRGEYWVWFGGGLSGAEQAHISQQLSPPDGEIEQATLRFRLKMPESRQSGEDVLRVLLDDVELLNVPDTAAADYMHYTLVTLDITEHIADAETLIFAIDLAAQSETTYYLDEVSLALEGRFAEPLPLPHYLPLLLQG